LPLGITEFSRKNCDVQAVPYLEAVVERPQYTELSNHVLGQEKVVFENRGGLLVMCGVGTLGRGLSGL
jgi:hypothetical protein